MYNQNWITEPRCGGERSKKNRVRCSNKCEKKPSGSETSRVKMKECWETNEETRLSTESEAKLLPSHCFSVCEVDANNVPPSWAKENQLIYTYW